MRAGRRRASIDLIDRLGGAETDGEAATRCEGGEGVSALGCRVRFGGNWFVIRILL